MRQPTIEKLHDLRLGAMANALTAQLQQPEIDAMPFAERLALLVDIQHSAMLTAALAQRLTRAGMRQSACMENLDLRTPRGLDRTTIQALASGLWIRQHCNVLISGAAGVGKSWIACALGNQAARDGVSVLYKRLSRLLDELAIARLHGRQARLLKTLARTRLLILDDWAMVKLTAASAPRPDGGHRRSPRPWLDHRGDRNPRGQLAPSDWGSDIRRRDPGSSRQQRISPRAHGQVDARQRRPSGGGGSGWR